MIFNSFRFWIKKKILILSLIITHNVGAIQVFPKNVLGALEMNQHHNQDIHLQATLYGALKSKNQALLGPVNSSRIKPILDLYIDIIKESESILGSVKVKYSEHDFYDNSKKRMIDSTFYLDSKLFRPLLERYLTLSALDYQSLKKVTDKPSSPHDIFCTLQLKGQTVTLHQTYGLAESSNHNTMDAVWEFCQRIIKTVEIHDKLIQNKFRLFELDLINT